MRISPEARRSEYACPGWLIAVGSDTWRLKSPIIKVGEEVG